MSTEYLYLLPSIAIIISLVALGMSYFNYKESKKQTKSTYLPEIAIFGSEFRVFIDDSDFFLSEVEDCDGLYKEISVKKEDMNLFKYLEKEKSDNPHPNIKLTNIGMGTAKNITLEWKFKVKEVVDRIKKMDRKEQIKFDFSGSPGFLGIIGPGPIGNCSTNIMQRYYPLEKNFLKKNEEIDLYFPHIFLSLFEILVYIYWREHKVQFIPSLFLNITYEDISGNKYNKQYEVIFGFGTRIFSQGGYGNFSVGMNFKEQVQKI